MPRIYNFFDDIYVIFRLVLIFCESSQRNVTLEFIVIVNVIVHFAPVLESFFYFNYETANINVKKLHEVSQLSCKSLYDTYKTENMMDCSHLAFATIRPYISKHCT